MILSCCNADHSHSLGIEGEVVQCPVCRTAWQKNPPGDAELSATYSQEYYDSWGSEDGDASIYWDMKLQLADSMLSLIPESSSPLNILDIGCATGSCLAAAIRRGWKAWGVDVNPYAVKEAAKRVPEATVNLGGLETVEDMTGQFDAIVCSDVLEHFRAPARELKRMCELLKQGGSIIILTPNIQSPSRKMMGRRWPHFKREHLIYFSPDSIKSLLGLTCFHSIEVRAWAKQMTMEYFTRQLQSYPIPVFTPLSRWLLSITPASLSSRVFPIHMGEMLVVANKR